MHTTHHVIQEGRVRDLMEKMEAAKAAWEIASVGEFRCVRLLGRLAKYFTLLPPPFRV